MHRTVQSLAYATALGLGPLLGPGCGSPGAQFVPATGVLAVTGTEGPDSFVVSANASGAIVVNGGVVPIAGGVPTLGNTVRIELHGLGGDDQLVISAFGAPLPDAVLRGGSGSDVLVGGAGNDEITGGPGNDQIQLGAGDDTVVWAPGDGQDVIEGQAGLDTLLFAGSDAGEHLEVFAAGARARMFRDVDAVTLDFDDLEAITIAARGGVDSVVVGDLSGTDVKDVRLDLGRLMGGVDGEADTVTVNATNGPDSIGIAGETGGIRVFGLPASVRITAADPGQDQLVLNALGGADLVGPAGPGAEAMRLTLNGGLGDDTLVGSPGPDVFTGGDGADTVWMGDGDDTFTWNPGDDNDLVEGQGGFDTLTLNGGNVGETIEIEAVGHRVRFSRNVANVALDLGGVERLAYRALGGADLVFVRNLKATDVAFVDVALAAAQGGGDGQRDSVFIEGTDAADLVRVTGDAGQVTVAGLAAEVSLSAGESANDSLLISTLAGDDAVDASGLGDPSVALSLEGGDDDDVLIGGDGGDVLFGGEGDDVLIGGPGLDALDGGPGNNVVIQ